MKSIDSIQIVDDSKEVNPSPLHNVVATPIKQTMDLSILQTNNKQMESQNVSFQDILGQESEVKMTRQQEMLK